MPRDKIVVGNWKMNPETAKEAEKLFTAIAKSVSPIRKTEIVICPPFLYLTNLKKFSKKISLGRRMPSDETSDPLLEKFRPRCYITLELGM